MNLPTAVKFLPNGDMLILELGGKIWKVPAGRHKSIRYLSSRSPTSAR